ncbi:MAG: dTDP-4-dehydrorhamnose 3,5-epimerase [Anaerolineae bacterium]
MGFTFEKTALPDVILITPQVYRDDRGYFFESYKKSEFAANDIAEEFIQENCSFSIKGVLRGLHYQLPPFAQGKLVACASGSVFDVAVDIRRDSSTFGEWVGFELSAENKRMLYVPPGFAHGFYVLEAARLIYKITARYAPDYEGGIMWNDSEIGIRWPAGEVILSEKDKRNPLLGEAKLF